MIFHTKLLGVNVNAGKLGLGLGQFSIKNHTQLQLSRHTILNWFT